METLKKKVSEFAVKNRQALKPAEKWLNDFDGEMHEAWEIAINRFSPDWRKVVFIAWLTFDANIAQHSIEAGLDLDEWSRVQVYFEVNVIFNGRHSSFEHPNYYLIQNALNEGKKAVSTKRRGASVRNDHVEEAYKALVSKDHRSGITAEFLANCINKKYSEKLWKMKPDNVRKSRPWKDCHPKKK